MGRLGGNVRAMASITLVVHLLRPTEGFRALGLAGINRYVSERTLQQRRNYFVCDLLRQLYCVNAAMLPNRELSSTVLAALLH